MNETSNLQVGFTYSIHGYQARWKDLNFGTPQPRIADRAKFKYRFHYLNVPVNYQHKFGSHEQFYLRGGIVNSVFIKEIQSSLLDRDGDIKVEKMETDDEYNTLVISGNIGFGYTRLISDKLRLDLGPHFQCNISQIIDTPVTGRLWHVGLGAALWYEQ
ncbi:MAG: outer membrane beta-barrel protein [Saprospiraceae bacterium]|nr:outer membrane beta-barrel protein [Saprospiraceae bacterium]